MAETHNENSSRWMLRYEVAVDPQHYPRVHALLGQKGEFAQDFAANMERLAQEYLAAVEQHLKETVPAQQQEDSAAPQGDATGERS